jgi:catechol 2,3-dioxygenase-like lactoylglutathione lyase family enzyme
MTLGDINHISVTVGDLDRSFAFYDPLMQFLGYRESERGPDYVEWLGPAGWFILRSMRRETPHDRYARGLHHLAWSADNREQVDAFHRLLVKQGATVLEPPQAFLQYSAGYYAVFFEDPDGIKLELAHTPAQHRPTNR